MFNEAQIAFSAGEIQSGLWLSGVVLFFYLVIEIKLPHSLPRI